MTDPFFLVYKSRSGSTFLADVLVRHPEVGIAPESNVIPRTLSWARKNTRNIENEGQLHELLEIIYAEPKFVSWGMSRQILGEHMFSLLPLSIADFVKEAIALYRTHRYPGCSVFGLKQGGWWYNENVPLLKELFPGSVFIHLIRDGRAVFSSSKRAVHTDRGMPLEHSASLSAVHWKRMVEAFDSNANAGHAMEIRYEDLIEKPEPTLKVILEFLKVRQDPSVVAGLLLPHEAAFINHRNAHLHEYVGSAPKRARISAWRAELPPKEIEQFERIAAGTLIRKGYRVEFGRVKGDRLYEIWVEGKERLARLNAKVIRKNGRR